MMTTMERKPRGKEGEDVATVPDITLEEILFIIVLYVL